MIALIAIVTLVIAVVVGILTVWISRRREKEGKPTVNYRAFFVMGIARVLFSIVLMVVSFMVIIVVISLRIDV